MVDLCYSYSNKATSVKHNLLFDRGNENKDDENHANQCAILLSPFAAQAAAYTDSYTDYVSKQGTTTGSTPGMPDKHMPNDGMHSNESEINIIQDHADITHNLLSE